jgi:Ca2+-binding EF-hand superfamily protein
VQSIVAISAYDENGDGEVSYDEFTAGAAAEFRRRDVNGDGVITPGEI